MCDAVAALRNVTDSISPNKQAAMRTLMLHFRRDLLWRANSSRVAENLLVLAQRKMGVDKPLLPAAECSFLDEQRSDAGFRAHDEACRGRACCRPAGTTRSVDDTQQSTWPSSMDAQRNNRNVQQQTNHVFNS